MLTWDVPKRHPTIRDDRQIISAIIHVSQRGCNASSAYRQRQTYLQNSLAQAEADKLSQMARSQTAEQDMVSAQQDLAQRQAEMRDLDARMSELDSKLKAAKKLAKGNRAALQHIETEYKSRYASKLKSRHKPRPRRHLPERNCKITGREKIVSWMR